MTMMSEFLNMGGYGAFVWPSYGISVAVLMLLVIFSVRRLHRIERQLKPLEQDRKSRRRKTAAKGGAAL